MIELCASFVHFIVTWNQVPVLKNKINPLVMINSVCKLITTVINAILKTQFSVLNVIKITNFYRTNASI